ncbi:MAG TPA: serine/threonine-protein kinase [Tepidisphaeraceae bacterium]|nr:serine/threonine-protein kinase [Tepidisphaeraceae bacterium]
MTPFPSERVQELLVEALKRPTADRNAFIDESCAGDSSVRSELEKLLAAHEEAQEFLAPPAAEKFLEFHDRAEFAPGESTGPFIGDHIGRYKLLDLLGEGGFGTVFLAEQERPIRRRVAVKVIKPGMDSRQVLARFSAERQALALMDHTNIAKVYDAGQTKSGRPYVVMELLEGPPITDYCKQQRLTTEQRVELFISVCHAVQHAHQKGIIHRDLKPSNVLVVSGEDRPVPKVIDFGIAKALAGSLGGHTFLTEQRQLLGTPEYVSPEQAGMGEMGIDTRTDVYSLGVLLYELLTGTTPFDPQELRQASFYQMQRMIIEEDPPRPSSRLGEMGAGLREIADARRIDPQLLRRQLKGDLDWIVMKCLAKSPAERYETAAALADDLNRYLSDQPVTAAAPGNVYQLRKLIKRHRAWFAGGVAVALALAGGTTASTLLYLRAQANATAAQRAAENAAAINKFLTDTLGFADPENAGRAEMPLREVLGLAETKLDSGSLAKQPEMAASVRTQLGKIYESVGLFSRAEDQLREAITIREKLPSRDLKAEADTFADLADVEWTVSNYSKAEEAYRGAVDRLEKTDAAHTTRMGQLLLMLGRVLMYEGREGEAAKPLDQGLAMIADVAGSSSYRYAEALKYRENFEVRRHRPQAVLAVRAERQSIYTHLLSPAGLRSLSDSQLADVRRQAGYPFDATQERLLTGILNRRMEDHGRYDPGVARAMEDLAECVIYSSRNYDRAESLMRDALEIRRRLYGSTHPRVAESLTVLATYLEWRGKYGEAVRLARESLTILENAYGPQSHDALREKLRLALREERAGDYQPASRHVHEVVELNDTADADVDQYVLRTRLAAYLLWTQCDYAGAERLCRQLVGPDAEDQTAEAATTLRLLADILISRGQFDEALSVSTRAVAACTTSPYAPLLFPAVKIAVWETHARALYLAGRSPAEIDHALDQAQKIWEAAPESFKQMPHDGTGFTTVDRTAHTRPGQRAEHLLTVRRYAQARAAAEQAAAEYTGFRFAPESRHGHFLDFMLAVARAGSAPYDLGQERAVLDAYATVRDDPHILAIYKVEAHGWVADLYDTWKEAAKRSTWNAQAPAAPNVFSPATRPVGE